MHIHIRIAYHLYTYQLSDGGWLLGFGGHDRRKAIVPSRRPAIESNATGRDCFFCSFSDPPKIAPKTVLRWKNSVVYPLLVTLRIIFVYAHTRRYKWATVSPASAPENESGGGGGGFGSQVVRLSTRANDISRGRWQAINSKLESGRHPLPPRAAPRSTTSPAAPARPPNPPTPGRAAESKLWINRRAGGFISRSRELLYRVEHSGRPQHSPRIYINAN